MLCYDCSKAGRDQEAVGLCHHCLAGLCADHACVTADPVTALYPLCKAVVLPQKARQLHCATCLQALQQAGAADLLAEPSSDHRAPVIA